MRCLIIFYAFGLLAALAADKPVIKLAVDGFPVGHEIPEGAACDLMRSFIWHDNLRFSRTCIRLYVGGTGPEKYARYLKDTAVGLKVDATFRKDLPPRGPKAIVKLFTARALSQSIAAPNGYATFGFQKVMFVDMIVYMHDDRQTPNRILVIKDRDGKWYAHPMPEVSPVLCTGLKKERFSKEDFTEAYEIQK